jgi:two-component system LytT family response regulator
MKLRTVIVDDEPLARQLIGELLAGDPDVEVVAECASGAEALEVLPRLKPDLLFLDVQMPGLSGFDVLSRLPGGAVPYVIFVTAHDRYAMRAFELHALDYLLKPFARQRFEQSLARAKEAIRNQGLSELARKISSLASSVAGASGGVNRSASTYRTELRVDSGHVLRSVKASEIRWIEAADQYVRLHTGDASHLLSESLSSLEKELDPQDFFRIHRSTLVNRTFVREVRTEKNGTHSVILTDGTRLRLSRGRRKLLTDLL